MVAEVLAAEAAMKRAVALLADGEIVAIPTETVYGLAGDAASGQAVARIFEAKGRPRFNPLIAHVTSLAMAETIGRLDPTARRLAEAFWPGPLTLVVPMQPGAAIHPLVTAGLDSVALRMPRGFASDLIATLGRPIAAPSANRSGRLSATTAAAVVEQLGQRISLVVDGGPTPVGVESTIVQLTDGPPRLLRPGGVPAEAVGQVAGRPLVRASGGPIVAPGMLASHYAPQARVRLGASEVRPGEALLAFGPRRIARAQDAAALENLSPAGDLREAAARLFSALRALDASGAAAIAVEPIPEVGLGEAINDRLARAAAPREEAVPA